MKSYLQNEAMEARSQRTSSVAARAKKNIVPNSARCIEQFGEDSKDGGVPALDMLMRQRIQEQFLTHQIPRAEREADDIAANVRNAGTPQQVKSVLGSQMGADFSSIRFHTDAAAAGKADAIGARAFTTGRDVYFDQDGFDAGIAAHELVHTAQQGVVESATQVTSAPEGGVQMLPNWMKKAWGGIKKFGNGIGYAATALKEFIGGKTHLLSPSRGAKRAALKSAKAGDMSQAASIDEEEEERLVTAKTAEIANAMQDPGITSADIIAKYAPTGTGALNPITRKALSAVARSDRGGVKGGMVTQAMETIDQRMMMNTLRTPDQSAKDAMKQHYEQRDDQKRLMKEYGRAKSGKIYLGGEGATVGERKEAYRTTVAQVDSGKRGDEEAQNLADSDIARSQNASDAMMRSMFLMHFGDFQRTDTVAGKKGKKQKQNNKWDQTMANAFAHGGRTGFVFDSTKGDHVGSDRVAESIFGANMGHAAGMHKRTSGTHHVDQPSAEAIGTHGYKEKSGVKAAISSSRDKHYQHYGMDMAIGGIGKAGGADANGAQMINADGRSGHMYIGNASSSESKKGVLLMGLESDSPYRMNQMGHMHNAAAVAEDSSSTGGLKTDIQGDKYGGRTVDLSGVGNNELADVIDAFSAKASAMRSDPQQAQQYEQLLSTITGKRMDDNKMEAMLSEIMPVGDAELPDEYQMRIKSLVNRARRN